MMKQRSIKNTFARHFVSILACSLLATLVTWGLLVLLLGYLFNLRNNRDLSFVMIRRERDVRNTSRPGAIRSSARRDKPIWKR